VAKLDDSTSAKVDRRQALILAAFETIAERGYEGLRVRDVAFQVGLNGATLHHYFPTKEVLIQAVLVYANERLHSILRDLSGTPSEQMRQYLQRLRVMMRTEPELFIVLVETNLRAQHGLALHYVMQQEAYWHEQLASILKAGVVQQQWGLVVEPIAMATTIVTLVEGAGMWLVARPDRAETAIRQIELWLAIN
jgi:AcrR family transcriptional regulator